MKDRAGAVAFANMEAILERYHWDIITYKSQPSEDLDSLFNYLNAKSQFIENKQQG